MVDDDPRDSEVFGFILQHRGWTVDSAPGPEEALKKVQEHSYDVVLIDRQMLDPQTGRRRATVGDDLLEQVVALCPYVCPIILTHFSDPTAAIRAGKFGAFDYLVKGDGVNFIDRLDAVCRKGVRSQQLKRLRHAILALSFEQLLRQAAVLLQDFFEAAEPAVLYLEVAPGGALIARPMEGQEDLPLLHSLRANSAGAEPLFVPFTSALQRVLDTRLPALARRRDEVTGATLTERPGTQLLVPVQVVEHPDDLQRTLRGLLWLECPREEALDKEDARLVADLADCLADALAIHRARDAHGQVTRQLEQIGLLQEVQHLRKRLQVSQGNLGAVLARLRRGDCSSGDEMLSLLREGLAPLEHSLWMIDWLLDGRDVDRFHPRTVDLKPLVERAAGDCRRPAEKVGCQLRLEVEDAVPPVLLDPDGLLRALGGLLQNALEAIQRRRSRLPEAASQGDWVALSLRADPTREHTVLLAVQDSGPGFEQASLAHLFQRYYSTKGPEEGPGHHGFGLWEAKRFAEGANGAIRACNLNAGGAEVQFLFPACAGDGLPSAEPPPP
jgi:signal transduction histidine kinase